MRAGVELEVYFNDGDLEYDWIVQPGADIESAQFVLEGADRIDLDAQGNLVVGAGLQELIQRKPLLYQAINGKRKQVGGRFSVSGWRVGFSAEGYDPTKPLVIDPRLIWSVKMGGTSDPKGAKDFTGGITADDAGNAFLTGLIGTADFPVRAGAFHDLRVNTSARYSGPFVMKMDATGAIVWVALVDVGGQNIALDPPGNVLVSGYGGISKLSPDGASLIWVRGINSPSVVLAVDRAGNSYVAAVGTNPASAGAYQQKPKTGTSGAFVAKYDPTGTTVYSTYLTGSTREYNPAGITTDSAGNAYVIGATASADFPVTPGAYQTQFPVLPPGSLLPPPVTCYAAKLNASGSGLMFSTFLSPSNTCAPVAIQIDGQGNTYVLQDYSVKKLNPTASTVLYSTQLSMTSPKGLAVDQQGVAYTTGITVGAQNLVEPLQQFLLSEIPCDPGNRIPLCSDAFLQTLSPDGATIFSSFLGGDFSDYGESIFVDHQGKSYLYGVGLGTFPITGGIPVLDPNRPSLFVARVDYGGDGPFLTPFSITNAAGILALSPGDGPLVNSQSGALFGPGSLLSLYVTGLGDVPAMLPATSFPLPYELAGVTAFVGLVPAPILAVANHGNYQQVNIQVPYASQSAAGWQGAGLQVVYRGASAIALGGLLPWQPALLSAGSGNAAIQHADGTLVSSASPAHSGEVVTIYATGLGVTSPSIREGIAVPPSPQYRTTTSFTATVGTTAADVLFSGLTPGFAGLYQVNLRVPSVAPGDYPTAIVADAPDGYLLSWRTSNSVTLSVR